MTDAQIYDVVISALNVLQTIALALLASRSFQGQRETREDS